MIYVLVCSYYVYVKKRRNSAKLSYNAFHGCMKLSDSYSWEAVRTEHRNTSLEELFLPVAVIVSVAVIIPRFIGELQKCVKRRCRQLKFKHRHRRFKNI